MDAHVGSTGLDLRPGPCDDRCCCYKYLCFPKGGRTATNIGPLFFANRCVCHWPIYCVHRQFCHSLCQVFGSSGLILCHPVDEFSHLVRSGHLVFLFYLFILLFLPLPNPGGVAFSPSSLSPPPLDVLLLLLLLLPCPSRDGVG
ncbi:hypothetical protein LY78DRAFT_481604 [Colletotrichum sublineola]|nr:hypothetical protein LY78DRAFT_481604 [Colletotrichum sublineola]